MQANPTVSIIISAYNRPRVIPFAIKSVLASDFNDWELIIIGDGCNAETEAAVRAFTDPRIWFHNLPANTGHQSTPHNKGVERARGEFVFFLNQDDMYFPDHVSKRLAFMRATGADVSWSPILLLQQSGLEAGPIDVEKDRLTLDGSVADGRYNPESFVISSCWAVRREICTQVGEWLQPQETRLSPSQEWLFRAHRQGRHMAYHPYVSVLCIHSGVRRYSYVSAHSFEHERAWSWIKAGPVERSNLMNCVAVQDASELVRLRKALAQRENRWRTLIERAVEHVGIHPHSLQRFREGLARGKWVSNHTGFTASKPPELPLQTPLPIGNAGADVFLGRGWHAGEGRGRWSAAEVAEIFFTAPQYDGNLTLQIFGHTLRGGDRVRFRLNGASEIIETSEGRDKVTIIPLSGKGAFHLTVSVDNPTSPQNLGQSGDSRVLGYWMSWLRIAPATTPRQTKMS
jgi:hypothetical protein